MNGVLSLYLVILCIQEVLAGCPEYVFKMVSTRNFLAEEQNMEMYLNFSVYLCAEKCVDIDGESFSFNTETNTCFVYSTRIYHGYSTGNIVQGIVTYWRESNECPHPYVYNDVHNVCYKIDKTYLSWWDAERSCENDGAVLILASDPWKYDLLVDIYTNTSNGLKNSIVYIGGNNLTETDWRWLDGTPMTNWATDEPNSNKYNIELCAAMKHDAGNDHRLMDIGCYRKEFSICEIPMRKK